MSNRKQRRAVQSMQRKGQLPAGPPMQHPIIAAYQTAANFQKLVTEVHDGAVESQRWTREGEPEAAELAEDIEMLRKLCLDARRNTIEAGLAVIQLVDPTTGPPSEPPAPQPA
jgi:hypothetical protein